MKKAVYGVVLCAMMIQYSTLAYGQSPAPDSGVPVLRLQIGDVAPETKGENDQNNQSANKVLTRVLLAILGNIKTATFDFGFDGTFYRQEIDSKIKTQIDLNSLFFDAKVRMNQDLLLALATGSMDKNFEKMLPNILVNTENMLVIGSLDLERDSPHLRVNFCKNLSPMATCDDSNQKPLHIKVGNKLFGNIIGLGFRSISANLAISHDGKSIEFRGGCDAYKILTDLGSGKSYEKTVTCTFNGFASLDNKIGQKIHVTYR